jgi:hypothetical protein
MLKKRPCSICGRWFFTDPRVGDRQRACSSQACQAARRSRTQDSWRERNPDYFAARRIQKRHRDRGDRASEPLRMGPPLDRLPWDVAQDEFGPEGADFLGIFGRVLLRDAQDQRNDQGLDPKRESRRHLRRAAKDQRLDAPSSAGPEEAPP